VFIISMGATAHCAKAIECLHTDSSGEIAI
jgi:hypothetical protein